MWPAVGAFSTIASRMFTAQSGARREASCLLDGPTRNTARQGIITMLQATRGRSEGRQIKQAHGFRQFLLRGFEKLYAEWALICTAHNLLKLIISVMLAAPADNAGLARDTVFAAVMIVCNGIVGVCLLWGGARHHEQDFPAAGCERRARRAGATHRSDAECRAC
jgi:hypothetical protein